MSTNHIRETSVFCLIPRPIACLSLRRARTTIRMDDREVYMEALEIASAKDDLEPFARFLADRIVLAHSKIANIDYNATDNR